jgi:putative FmdB family regulatory protein
MPLYEYCCTACSAKEELLTNYSSPTEHDCPVCGKTNGMQRQVSAPSINFSGGGWYAQGYSNSPPCKADKPVAKEPSPNNVPSSKECCGSCACNND